MRREELLADCGEIRPRRINVCYALRREANLKCLILTLFITGSTPWAIIWCGKTTRVTNVDFNAFPIATATHVSACDNGFSFVLAAFISMLYLLYLVECWYSKAREVISAPKVDVSSVYRKVEQMRGAKPLIWWKAISYHYVRRTKQFSHSRNGKTYTSSKVVNERVNTHVSTSCFLYAHCGLRDISRDLVDLDKFPLTKVTFSKAFIFSNALAAAEFQHQKATFFQEDSGYDDYVEMKERLDLIGVSFQDSMLACPAPDRLPWFLRKQSFWLASSVLLSWPLRFLLTLKTAHVHFQVTKLFGTKMMGPDVTFPWNYVTPHQWWRREAALRANNNIQTTSPSSSSPTRSSIARSSVPPSSRSSCNNEKKSPEDEYVTEKSESVLCDPNGGPAYIPHYIPPSYYSLRAKINGIPRSFTLLMPEPSLSSFGVSDDGGSSIAKSSSNNNFKSPDQQLVPSYSEALLLGDQSQCRNTTPTATDVDETREDTTPLLQSPPDYIQALRTSRPVFLPLIFRLRRCQTEKRVTRGSGGRNYPERSFRLEDVQPTFLHELKPPPPAPGSSPTPAAATGTHVNNEQEGDLD